VLVLPRVLEVGQKECVLPHGLGVLRTRKVRALGGFRHLAAVLGLWGVGGEQSLANRILRLRIYRTMAIWASRKVLLLVLRSP
jgi:hypothetical protein